MYLILGVNSTDLLTINDDLVQRHGSAQVREQIATAVLILYRYVKSQDST